MKIRGLRTVIKGLKDFGSEGTEIIKANIEAAGYNMQAESTRLVPVDLGGLKNSIKIETTSQGLSVGLVATEEYAPFIEFGTGGLVSVPKGMEEMALAYKGKDKLKIDISPQPYMFPAWDKERKDFVIRLNKELERLAKQV